MSLLIVYTLINQDTDTDTHTYTYISLSLTRPLPLPLPPNPPNPSSIIRPCEGCFPTLTLAENKKIPFLWCKKQGEPRPTNPNFFFSEESALSRPRRARRYYQAIKSATLWRLKHDGGNNTRRGAGRRRRVARSHARAGRGYMAHL